MNFFTRKYPVFDHSSMALFIFYKIRSHPYICIAEICHLLFQLLHIPAQIVYIKDLSRIYAKILFQLFRVHYRLGKLYLNILDSIYRPLFNLEIQYAQILVEIYPEQRRLHFGIQVSVAHVKVSYSRCLIFQLLYFDFSVVKTPHPAHKISFSVGQYTLDISFPEMGGSTEIELSDYYVFTLVDTELYLDTSVFQFLRLRFYRSIEIAFGLYYGTQFGRSFIDLSLIVNIPFFESYLREKLIFFALSVTDKYDLRNNRLLFKVKSEYTPLFCNPYIIEVALGIELFNSFIHLLNINRLAWRDLYYLFCYLRRKMDQAVKLDRFDLLGSRQNSHQHDSRYNTFH